MTQGCFLRGPSTQPEEHQCGKEGSQLNPAQCRGSRTTVPMLKTTLSQRESLQGLDSLTHLMLFAPTHPGSMPIV